MSMITITYASNGAAVEDGIWIARLSQGGQRLEILADPRTEQWSEVVPTPGNTPPVSPGVTMTFGGSA